MPGIMTGTIIGMAHALGETAPLLMIGMVAFIVDIPSSFTDAATVLPIQIYLWSDLPEIAFQSKTAAAIIVLLVFPVRHECGGDLAAQAFRAPLVGYERFRRHGCPDQDAHCSTIRRASPARSP